MNTIHAARSIHSPWVAATPQASAPVVAPDRWEAAAEAPESHASRWAWLAAGALALACAPSFSAAAPLPPPTAVVTQTVVMQTNAVTPSPYDNATAHQVRSRYTALNNHMQADFATFQQGVDALRQKGHRIDAFVQDGTGNFVEGNQHITVSHNGTSSTVMVNTPTETASCVHQGDTTTIIVRTADNHEQALIDSPQETILRNDKTRMAFHLSDGAGYQAGDFEVLEQPTPSHMSRRVQNGDNVLEEHRETLSGISGSTVVNLSDRFTVTPDDTSDPPVVLTETQLVKTNDTRYQRQTFSSREVQVRQDGSTRIRTHDGAGDTDVEEPANVPATPAPTSDPAPAPPS